MRLTFEVCEPITDPCEMCGGSGSDWPKRKDGESDPSLPLAPRSVSNLQRHGARGCPGTKWKCPGKSGIVAWLDSYAFVPCRIARATNVPRDR